MFETSEVIYDYEGSDERPTTKRSGSQVSVISIYRFESIRFEDCKFASININRRIGRRFGTK